MFFIVGTGTKTSPPITITDDGGRSYQIYYFFQYFSFFFIPIFQWGKHYFVITGGVEREITKEEYQEMKQTGKVIGQYAINPQSHHAQTYGVDMEGRECANEFCPICKEVLTRKDLYCPHCGQKQPVRA